MSLADDHRDWHRLARMEGTNPWACPWDCTDPPGADGEDDGPALYATVWYFRPGIDDDATGPVGYPVFSREQARTFAQVAAQRSGRAARVERAK